MDVAETNPGDTCSISRDWDSDRFCARNQIGASTLHN